MQFKTLLIAERMHREPLRLWTTRRAVEEPDRWLEISSRLGAFGTGLSAKNTSNERRLRQQLGLRYDTALNILPPSETPGQWCEQSARVVLEALGRLHRAAITSIAFGALEEFGEAETHPGMRLRRWVFPILLLCGRRVELAVTGNRLAEDYGIPVLTAGGYAARITVPHPSGSNRFWNDPKRIAEVRRRLESAYRAMDEDPLG